MTKLDELTLRVARCERMLERIVAVLASLALAVQLKRPRR